MIKNEWKSLWNNKILIIVVMAIIVIPVIYAGLFLKSMWDPYGNLDKLPVAVVNNDKSVEYNGKTLSVGSDMVDELKDLDEVAYVRFASVYREFKDVNTFMDELKKILDKEEK